MTLDTNRITKSFLRRSTQAKGLPSGWWETHSGCKFDGLAMASFKLKKVLTVALGPRLRAFLNFASPCTNHQIFATKAVSHQPLPMRLQKCFWVLLWALTIPYTLVCFVRRWVFCRLETYRSSLAIVSIGNIHLGGSGKTPLVLELSRHFGARLPCIVMRGYRGKLSKQGALVDPSQSDGPELYGDEAFMLAKKLSRPVYVGADRVASVKLIEQREQCGVVILDDAFQNLRLRKTVNLVTIEVTKDPSDCFTLPLGSLREPLSMLRQADAIILVGASEHTNERQAWRAMLSSVTSTPPIFSVVRRSDGFWDGERPAVLQADRNWVAFCGIAHPKRFSDDLRLHQNIQFGHAFPDHHRYRESDLDRLEQLRESLGAAGFVTTEKDWFKVAPRLKVRTTPIFSFRIKYELPSAFTAWLDGRLDRPALE